MDTMVDETVIPDEPSEEDKPEGWIDPGEAVPAEVVPEESPADNPAQPDQEESPAEEVDAGEDTGELDISEIAQQVIEGKWGVGQERRTKLSEAGYNVKDVEAEVNWILNNRS